MAVTTTASALPENGAWGNFAHKLLEGISAVCGHYQQQRMMLAIGEIDHLGTLVDIQAAARRRDAARMRSIFEGCSLSIPEGRLRDY